MDQNCTPLYDALYTFAEQRPLSLHVPGHKNGAVFAEKGQKHFRSLLGIDATELSGLDDLHDPAGCIRKAQELLADLYQVRKSYLLVNGSTVGNLAMVLAACSEGDRVLVQSNCHKSVMNGLELAGAKPVFLQAYVDESTQVPVGLSCDVVQKALNQYPDTKAVILTYPNYYGMCADLHGIIALAHERNIPVLVDEAHGAHFCLGAPFPSSALSYGADIVVHSAHKTLPALTMGSYLHVNSGRVHEKKLSRYLSMLQSSSPSYPIMASLDLARSFLASLQRDEIEELLLFIASFKKELSGIPQLQVIEHEGQDPLKIMLQTKCELTGYELQSVLERANIYTEMADPYHVLLVLPIRPIQGLIEAVPLVKEALEGYEVQELLKGPYPCNQQDMIKLSMGYKELDQYSTMIIPLSKAKGRIAAEMVVPYPPGIPLLMRGERIEEQQMEQIHLLIQSGARFQGSAHISDSMIEVYEVHEGEL